MSGVAPRVLAAALAVFAAGAVLLVLWSRPGPAATPGARVEALAGEMRCPDCQALSVAESRTAAAAALRSEIERLVAEGRSDDQVRQYFVDRYGEWILLAPPDPLVWWSPVVVLIAGLALLAAWLRLGRRGVAVTPGPGRAAALPSPDAEQRRRIDEELEALDG